MTQQNKFEAFMQKVMQRPLPNGGIGRTKTFARELAEGAVEELWETDITYEIHENYDESQQDEIREMYTSQKLDTYLERRWNRDNPSWDLLSRMEYLFQTPTFFRIAPQAFQLITETDPAEIFISYRGKESSVFALLVLARLKDFELNAFLDMSIRPGDNWHAYIKEQIQQRDYFILLLGKETLGSDVVKDEILWAIEAGAEIIPIWHNGFEYKEGEFDLPPEIQKVLHSNHSIRVLEESALAYNNAIVELLNRFGVTP